MGRAASDAISASPYGLGPDRVRTPSTVNALPGSSHKLARAAARADDRVFTTSNGRPRDRTNARQRVIIPVVERADELLAERGHSPLPRGVTAHKLRHTFASILVMIGEDPTFVMSRMGHHAMRRDEGVKERMKALV